MFGRFLDRGELFTIQTGVNGIVVAVLLPRRHLERPQRYARAAWEEIATALDMLAGGLRASDVEQLRDVAGQLRGVRQVGTDWETTLGTAREVVLFNPTLWKSRAPLAELNRLFLLAKRTETTMEMLARQSLSMVEEVGHLPAIGEVIADCGSAAHRVSTAITHWDRPTGARAILLAVAAHSSPAEIESADWRPTALMSMVRALIVDLLQATGMSRLDARAALADTWGRPFADDHNPTVTEDDASTLWG